MSKPRVLNTLLPLLILGSGLLYTDLAQAVEGELTLGMGPTWNQLPTQGSDGQTGYGGQAWAEYRFDHFWGVTFGGGYDIQLSIPEDELAGQHIGQAWAGVIYNLDVATYVPFATFSAASYFAQPALTDPEGTAVNFGARIGVGVDWRRYRHWSIGAEADIHAFFTDLAQYPVYLNVALRLNYHTDLF